MPYDMAMESELSRRQFHAVAREVFAENERLRSDYASLATFNPDWDRVAAAQDSVREHMDLVNQLKAENAGLKTGYEAYEQVVQGLKAENEALRKALGDCADELSAEIICKHGGQKLEDMHPVTRRLYERDMETVVEARAAMGKGEQS